MTPPRRLVRTRLVERRDPRAAMANTQWVGRDQPQVPEWNGEQAFRLGVMANVVAFRCIQVWADAVSAFPFRAGPTPPERPGGKADHNPNARLAQLLGPPTQRVAGRMSGPNRNMTGRQLIAWTVAQRVATGRNAWEIEWTGPAGRSEVAGLWPLPAAHLNPIATVGRSSDYFKGYRYTADAANPVDLTADQVFYGWTMSGTDPRQAVAPLQAARYAITLAVMGDRQNLAFLQNGAVPAAMITTAEFPSDDERRAFQQEWSAAYQGPDNAGKVKFHEVGDGDGPVGDSIDVKVLGVSQRDAQFVQAHVQSLKEVAWGLGVPWSKIDSADRTFSNAEVEERTWLLERVVPFLAMLEDEINLRLAPMVGAEVGWFDLSGVDVLRPRPRFTATEGVALADAGLALPGEVRDELGLDPDVDLPEPAVPEVPEPPAPVVAPSAPAVEPSRARRRVESRALSAEQQEQRRATIWRRNDSALRGLERAFARRWAAFFAKQGREVVAALTGKNVAARLAAASQAREIRADIAGPLDPQAVARWRTQAQDLADLMHTAAATAGVTRVNNAFGVSFDLEAPFIQDFIQARSNQLAGQVTDTTYRAVQQALADGVAQGASVDDLAAAVRQVFDVASSSRATTIARTEVISAANGSASLAAAQLPADVAAGQEWVSTRDERTRDDHVDADGQVVAMGQPFDVGGELLLYPGDPGGDGGNTINCRCTVAFLTPKDMEGRARPQRVVPAARVRSLVRLVSPGVFDEAGFRRSLQEVVAA